MLSIKEYKAKLHSLKNTEKMTRTMKLVSASKLRQAHLAQGNARQYANKLTSLIARLAASVESASHPLLTPRSTVKTALVLIFTSDKGLCGGFNNNLNRKTAAWIKEKSGRYERIDVSFCGKRGFMFFKNRFPVKKHYEGSTIHPGFVQAKKIGEELRESFVSKEYDEIFLAYNRFHNPLTQTPVIKKILPIEPAELMDDVPAFSSDYIFEPGMAELLQALISDFFYFKIYYTLLENAAGEHGARMTAMDKASQNADELIDKYVLLRNRARQASITKELIEIVSGAEALK